MSHCKIGKDLVILALYAGMPAAAYAQEIDPPSKTASEPKVDDIVVTGSRIPLSGERHEVPVSITTREQIERTSAQSIDDVLARSPLTGGSSVSKTSTLLGNGNAFADLRNLGPSRTLVMVDGHRFPLSANNGGEGVDLNNIPLSFVDHVEVFRDGASALYGADAIGGVINIITRRKFDGLEVNGNLGSTTRGGGFERGLSATIGKTFDRGALAINAGYYKRDPLQQNDRAWARNVVVSSFENDDGSIGTVRGSGITPGGVTDSAITYQGRTCRQIVVGPGQARCFISIPGPGQVSDRFPSYEQQFLTAGQRRITVNGLATYDILPGIEARIDFNFTDRRSFTRLGAMPIAPGVQNPDFTTFTIPASNPTNFFGQDVVLDRRLAEFGVRTLRTDATTYRINAGLSGKVLSFDWSAYYQFGQTTSTFVTPNLANYDRMLESIGLDDYGNPAPNRCSSDPACASLGQFNYFGPNSLTPAQVKFLRYDDVTKARYTQDLAGASLTGTLFRLPAGPLAISLGGEYRREFGDTQPDSLSVIGYSSQGIAEPISGGYSVGEVFGEARIPLLKDIAFVRSLSVDASGRYSHFSNFGSAEVYQVRANWVPVRGLSIRASTGTGFRAPAISELFAGASTISQQINDPCDSQAGSLSNTTVAANCAAQGLSGSFQQSSSVLTVTAGGNSALKPETSRTFSAGFDLNPIAIPRFSLTADYYDIRIKNTISADGYGGEYIINKCYQSAGLSDPLCKFVSRYKSGPSAGQVSQIIGNAQNIGAIKTNGVDISARYTMTVGQYEIGLSSQHNAIFSYKRQPLDGVAFVELAGTDQGPFAGLTLGGISKWRSVTSLDVKRGPITFDYTVRHQSGFRYLDTDQYPKQSAFPGGTPTVVYSDVSLRYATGRYTVVFGMDNIFDRDPPFYQDNRTNTNPHNYDVEGRFVYIKVGGHF